MVRSNLNFGQSNLGGNYFGLSEVRATDVGHNFQCIFWECNLAEPEYYLAEPEYNLAGQKYNLGELEYNLAEPEYNLTEPEYKLNELVILPP